jgi:hypothetical protein
MPLSQVAPGLIPNKTITNAIIGQLGGMAGEGAVSEVRGKFAMANYNKLVYGFNVTAVTVPVVANNLVSVFTLWNPPASGIMGELVDTDIGQVLATTVVDAVGWYYSTGAKALAGTFTTLGTALSGQIGSNPQNAILPYSAYTHSGTPTRFDIICSFGAVTDAVVFGANKLYDGRILIPPGTAISVAMSTAAGTTSGLDISARWVEFPL